MRIDELDAVWLDVEQQINTKNQYYQRLICVDLLYRAYAGATGIPSKRFLSIEIPDGEKDKFDAFIVPQGFTMDITKPVVKHDGYAACVVQAASSDQNDVFTIVAKDILDDLSKQKKAEDYIDTLLRRIEKWRRFFQNPVRKKLSDNTVIGLIGELTFILTLSDNGVACGTDIWNGPIKSAQDFQGTGEAVEIKTAATHGLEYVHISSEAQLDYGEWENLFLVAYRVERNDVSGIKLPALIAQVEAGLPATKKVLFKAGLRCLGYADEDAGLYTKGYLIREHKVYDVKDGFPCLLRQNLPSGIKDVQYKLSLSCCDAYISDMQTVIKAVKEHEYGQRE